MEGSAMSDQISPNEPIVRWGEQLAKQYREGLFAQEDQASPAIQFKHLCQFLGDYKLESEEAIHLAPLLLEAAKIWATEAPVLPGYVVDCCVFQLGQDWLQAEVAKEFWGWSSTIVQRRLVVASEAITKALEGADFKALEDFGIDVAEALGEAGVDLMRLVKEFGEVDPEGARQFCLTSPHPVDCCCGACRFRSWVLEVSKQHLIPEGYLLGLCEKAREMAVEAFEDQLLFEMILNELGIAVTGFLRYRMRPEFYYSLPDEVLAVCEQYFRGYDMWPPAFIGFLARHTPSQPLEDWAKRSGWVYIGGPHPKLVSAEVAEFYPKDDPLSSVRKLEGSGEGILGDEPNEAGVDQPEEEIDFGSVFRAIRRRPDTGPEEG